MSRRKGRFLIALNVLQFSLLVCAALYVYVRYYTPPASAPLDVTGWPEEKASFAAENSWYNEREMLFMNFRDAPVDLCCLGDSITQKFEWQDAFGQWRVANRGIGSDTVDGILARLDSVEALQPDTISLLAGVNDLGQERTPEEVAALYRQLLAELRERLPQCTIVVNSILPVRPGSSVSNGDIERTNELLQALCAEEDICYLDINPLLSDDKGELREEYALDNVHLTAEGYAAWLSVLEPALEEAAG